MPEYRLTPDAENDLLEIAIYTIKTWGFERRHLRKSHRELLPRHRNW